MIRTKQFPIGSTVRLEQLAENPYPIFEQLQSHEPVSWIESLQMWFVTRRADVIALMQDKQTFTVESSKSLLRDTFGLMMLSAEGETHTRLRQPFNAPFLPKAVRARAVNDISQRTHQLLDSFVADNSVDLATAFSDRLALYTTTAILGVPIENYDEFRGWYNDFNAALGNFTHNPAIRQRGQAAAQAFRAVVGAHLQRLRVNPDGTVLSDVIAEGSLTDDEILSAAMVIIFGGLETTAAMFSNTIWALLNHPEQLEAARGDVSLMTNAVEEALRWESPVQTVTRQVLKDVEFGGVCFKRGDMVQGMLGAANRDLNHFERPERFDIYRHNAGDHLAFGVGKHYCLGAALARLEGQIGLSILFERLPNLRLHSDYPSKPYGHEFRSTPTLQVQW